MKNNLWSTIILMLLFSYSCAKPISAQENTWPQFRGMNSGGHAEEDERPPVNFGPEENLIWSIDLPYGHSSPCIWDDNIFITACPQDSNLLLMYCIDRQNGSIKWEKNIEMEEFEKTHYISSPATATPATDGERVVFYFGSYGLLCYDFEGNIQWELKRPVPFSRHGSGASPVIIEDKVILNCFVDNNDPSLIAINKFDGEITWKYSAPIDSIARDDSYSTPVRHNDQIITYWKRDVAAYDINSGKRIWWMNTDLGDAVCTPVIGNGYLYIGIFSTMGNPTRRKQFPSFSELIAKYDNNEDKLLDKTELKDFKVFNYIEMEVEGAIPSNIFVNWWDYDKNGLVDSTEYIKRLSYFESSYKKQGLKAIPLNSKGHVDFTHLAWADPDIIPHVTSPLYHNGNLYTIKSGGLLSCYNAENGELYYRERIGEAGPYIASPVIANGKIYITSAKGTITVVDAGNELKILAKNEFENFILATPAIVDNKIYVRTWEKFYAFGE